jgi:glycosyltransferase involved in cell wall biosynthesis
MRIGFDAKRAFYNSRGLGNYSRDTMRILSAHNPDEHFYLFTPKTKNAIAFDYGANCEVIAPNSFFYKKLTSLWRTFGITQDINRLQLDVYHGLSHELPVGIEKSKAASVITMHDLIFLKLPELYPWIDRQLYKKKYIKSCCVADKVVAISQQTKQDLIDLIHIAPEKIEVVYQGCNPIFYQKVDDHRLLEVKQKYNLPQQFLLCVGAIEKRKNQKLILQALLTGKIDIPLVIVGRPTDYINELNAYIKENDLESKVLFLTDVSMQDLPAIYQSATIFVYPSLFEGFGIPILEALNSRLPVITSKGSCFEETGGSGSVYIDHTNPEELADAIQTILSSHDKQESMISEGLKHAAIFSDESISNNLMRIYRELL